MAFTLFKKEISDAKDNLIRSQNEYIEAIKEHNESLRELAESYKRLYLLNEDIIKHMEQDKQKQILTEVMNADAKDRLYDHVPDVGKKVTAIEWLVNLYYTEYDILLPSEDFAKAKAMEKEQITAAYAWDRFPCSDEEAEQYYNETYNK